MQTAEQIGLVLVSVGGGVATYFLTKRALSDINLVRSPNLLALCIAIICVLALISTGPIILLPFAILGTLSLLLPLIQFLLRRNGIQLPNLRRQSPPPQDRSPTSAQPNEQAWAFKSKGRTGRQYNAKIPLEIMSKKSGRNNRAK